MGTVAFVPDAPGADLLVVVAEQPDGVPVAAAVDADAYGVASSAWSATTRRAHWATCGCPARAVGGSTSDPTCSPTPGTWPRP